MPRRGSRGRSAAGLDLRVAADTARDDPVRGPVAAEHRADAAAAPARGPSAGVAADRPTPRAEAAAATSAVSSPRIGPTPRPWQRGSSAVASPPRIGPTPQPRRRPRTRRRGLADAAAETTRIVRGRATRSSADAATRIVRGRATRTVYAPGGGYNAYIHAFAVATELRGLQHARFGTRLACCLTIRLAEAGFRYIFLGVTKGKNGS